MAVDGAVVTAGQATVWAITLFFGGAFVLCIAAYLWCSLPGWLRELRDAFNDGRKQGEADADRLMGKHRPDCACPPCWDRWNERLIGEFDWQRAEADLQGEERP